MSGKRPPVLAHLDQMLHRFQSDVADGAERIEDRAGFSTLESSQATSGRGPVHVGRLDWYLEATAS
jgi:hypothetical protein